MSAPLHEGSAHHEEALIGKLDEVRARMPKLARDLQLVDDEFESMAEERERFDLVMQACDALEALDRAGAADLFWGEETGAIRTETHLRSVRGRVDAFGKRIEELQERRDSISTALDLAQQDADAIEDELYELACQAEARKHEWIIEREIDHFVERPLRMPWSHRDEDDDRLRRNLLVALLLSILFGWLLPMIPLPAVDLLEPPEVPARLTRLIEERRQTPVAPPKREQIAETRPETEEKKEIEVAEKEAPKPTPQEKTKVGSKGILAFRESFSSLAEEAPTDRLGARAQIRNTGGAARGSRSTRSLVATKASSDSGGINVAQLSRGMGAGAGGDLEGVEIGEVTSSIGHIMGEARPLSSGPGPSRTDEEIQIVFDRHKAALYRLYNRQLRKNPTLQGQIVLRLVIEPDGSVSLCEVQSSDMNAPELADHVVTRVYGFDFGAKEGVPPVKILYPIDFLPAG